MKEFKSGKSPILIATDVAARGLGKGYYESNLCLFFKVYSVQSIKI